MGIAAAVGVAVVVIASRAASEGATRATPAAAAAAAGAAETPRVKVRAPSPGLRLRAETGRVPGTLNDAAPGAVAFRAYTDDFVDAQAAAAAAHMAKEGLTLDETRELTYFGVLAVESQDWARVEALTGRTLGGEERRAVWESMMARSQEMRRHLQEEIARGAEEDVRWETIARVESGYLEDYYRITGMTPELLDALLLASVREQRVGQTIASLSPDDAERPPVPSGAKPGAFVKRDPLHPEREPVPVPVPVDEQPGP